MLTYPIYPTGSGTGYTSLGSMSFTWTSLLLFHLFIYPTFCFKFPALKEEHLTDSKAESEVRKKYSLVEKDQLWNNTEWDRAKTLEELLSNLRRLRRDVVKYENTSPTPDTQNESTESDTTPYVTPIIIDVSNNPTSLGLEIENDTTVVYESTSHLSPSSEDGHILTDVNTSSLSPLSDQTASLTPYTTESTFISKLLSIPSDTVPTGIFTSATTSLEENTTLDDIFANSSHYPESTGRGNDMSENITSSSPTKTTDDIFYTVTNNTSSNEGGGIFGQSTHTTNSLSTMYKTSSSEQALIAHSLMKQCMLIILILAIVCTVFILCTIALAAKLCALRNQQKRKQALNYTEMRCISTLLPENNRNNNVHVKKMKTFTNNGEDSEGDDNATLNSFLPEH